MSYYCIFQFCITACAAHTVFKTKTQMGYRETIIQEIKFTFFCISMKKNRYFILLLLLHREEGPECAPHFPSLSASKHSNKQTHAPSVKLTPCFCPGYLAAMYTPFSSQLPRTS